MTITKTTPAAAPAATPPQTAAPSSGTAVPVVAEQQAAGKGPAAGSETTPAADGKATSDKDGAAAAEPKTAGNKSTVDKLRGAPETYDLKAPEGFKVDGDVQTALTSVARELDLSNEAAQKVVNAVTPALVKQGLAAGEAMIANWLAETKADPEIGGAKLDETVRLAQKGLELGPPGLRKVLGPLANGGTGLGNQRDVLAFLAEVGRRVSADPKVVSGSPAAGAPPKTPEEKLAAFYSQPTS